MKVCRILPEDLPNWLSRHQLEQASELIANPAHYPRNNFPFIFHGAPLGSSRHRTLPLRRKPTAGPKASLRGFVRILLCEEEYECARWKVAVALSGVLNLASLVDLGPASATVRSAFFYEPHEIESVLQLPQPVQGCNAAMLVMHSDGKRAPELMTAIRKMAEQLPSKVLIVASCGPWWASMRARRS